MPSLTFESIRIRTTAPPLKRPATAKIGLLEEWPLILVDLHTREGIVGHSYITPYFRRAARYLIPALEDLAELSRGQPLAPFDSMDRGMGAMHLVGREGASLIALSALDMAAWDALAKAAELPLACYLGGTIGSVRAYNSNGLWLTPVADLARQARELIDEGGFSAVKMRLGRERISDDIAAITAVRNAVGPDVHIMSDFNQGMSLGDALQRCHGLDQQGLYWFEEPIVYDNYSGYAKLTRELVTPVQLGENFYGPRALDLAIRAQACDFVMPDPMRIGGVSGWLRAASIAGVAGVPMSTHLYPEVSAHLMRVTESAHWLEWQDWCNPIIDEPFEIADGAIQIPKRPGTGIAWNEKAVAKYAF